jgi:AmiR/NasT family two-component response regulator
MTVTTDDDLEVRDLEAELARERIRSANLQNALATSRCIGMAIGIVMERYKLTDEDAFMLLVRASQRTQRKLRDIAEHLVLTGAFDGAA